MVSSAGWGGAIAGSVAVTSIINKFVFVGTGTTLTTTASQRLTAIISGSIGVRGGTVTIGVDACTRLAGTTGDPVSRTQNFQVITLPSNVRTSVSPVTSLTPGAGNWEIGLCVASPNSTAFNRNLNDCVSGWAQVTN